MCENAVMIALKVQPFIDRARDFLRAMELLMGDPEYKSSSALLGIHCAISCSDDLRTGMGRGDLSSDDHGNAANDLRKLLTARNFA